MEFDRQDDRASIQSQWDIVLRQADHFLSPCSFREAAPDWDSSPYKLSNSRKESASKYKWRSMIMHTTKPRRA